MDDGSPDSGFVRRCMIVLALVALAAAVILLSQLMLMIFASVVLAVILRAIARLWLKLPIHEGVAVGLAVLSLLAIIGGLFWMFGDLVSGQFAALVGRIPEAVDATQRQLDAWRLDYDIRQAARDIGSELSGMTTRAGRFAASAGGVITNIVLVLAGAVFFAAQPKVYHDGLLRLIPRQKDELVRAALDDSGRALGLWLQAQVLSSIAITVMTYIGLRIIGVPSAAALAIIAGLFDFIPFIGAVAAGLPAVLIAFSVSPGTALWTLILYLIIQQIQGNILQPLIQKRSVDLSPAVLLFAVVAFGMVFGVVGVILSAPLTVVGYVLVQRLYIEQALGKAPRTPGPD